MKISQFLMAFILLCICNVAYAEELVIEMLDVGQADGILIRTADKVVLFDAGEAKDQVLEYLQERGITHIDMAVATHPHADHIGGMESVLRNMDVGVYLDNGQPHTTVMYTKLMEAVEEKVTSKQMKYAAARQGMKIGMGPEAHFEVLMPPTPPITGSRSDVNANSIVMKLVHGDNCILLSGDSEEETEQGIVMQNIGKCNIYKVAHHGSKHSSTDALLDMIQPEVGLISCGLANKHGHPSPETIEKLERRNIKYYRTDLSGTLKLISDGKTWRVEEEHPPLVITKINVNKAPKEVLRKLPGTGEKTADAIIAYRNANGGYKTVEEVLETPGVDRKRLEKILPFVTTVGGSVTGLTEGNYGTVSTSGPVNFAQAATADNLGKVNINIATAPELAKLPGMDMHKAELAVADRSANGAFKSCKDITRVKGIGVKTFEKLESLCTVSGVSEVAAGAVVAPGSGEVVAMPAPPEVIVKININTAPQHVIASMPGMNLDRAALVVGRRANQYKFTSCNEVFALMKDFDSNRTVEFLNSCSVQDSGASYVDGRVNINVAPLEVLKDMPGMSASKAEKLIEYRNTVGPFNNCSEIVKVNGIGQKTYEKLASVCIAQ